jgi:chromosome segregation and condensation protein ScpB
MNRAFRIFRRGGPRLEIITEGVALQITLELPEDIAQGLESKWKDLPRAALESLALEAYRSQALTAAQLRRMLGFETRMQVDAFLKDHEVYDFTVADFEQDRESLRPLRIARMK